MKFDDVEPKIKIDLHPSLEAVVQTHGLDKNHLSVALRDSKADESGRENIRICDNTNVAVWTAPALAALFRGNRPAPQIPDTPPPAYMHLFYFVERHALLFCSAHGAKTDREFEETYSHMRRRPDGRTVSELHSFIWQAAAALTGIYPLSAAEFDAIFGRLARSARTFGMGVVSRNYISTLAQTTGA